MSPPQRQTTMDPTFDPPFFNDNPFRENPFFKRLTNFTNKHMSEGLINASAKHFLSHFEYGSCLADFPALKERYGRIRELEDVDELQGFAAAGDYVHGDEKKQPYPATSTPRVRFVNYYTLSSGRKKQEKQHRGSTPGSESVDSPGPSLSYADTMSTMTTTSTASIASPGIPIEDRGQPIEDTNLEKVQSAGSIDASLDDLSLCDPEPMDEPVPAEKESEKTADVPVKEEDNLPPLPELPAGPPETPDFDQYTDKTVRKQVEKEHKRVRKAYDDAVKAHGKALQERRKLVEKRAKAARKEAKGKQDDDTRSLQGDDDDTNDQDKKQKEKKEKQKEKQKEEKEKQKVKQEMKKEKQLAEKEKAKEEKRQKEERKRAKKEKAKEMPGDDDQEHKDKKRKKFCMLPKRRDGGVDNTWVDVYMDDMDEVAAHCGLFFPGPHYDRLVGDVASRVVGWVEEDLSTRAIREYDGQ